MWCLAPAKPIHCRIVSVSTRCHSPFDQSPRHLPVLSLLSWWIAHTSLQKSAVCHVTICIYPASCTRMPECFRVVVKKKSGWPSDISTRLSSHDDELHDFFQPCRGPIATWFLNGFEPLQTWISIMDYFIMRAYVNTYAICIYVIIYVYIGAPQIVRIPGMIQLGSWEFCWKYQLKQFHVLIHWYSYYTIDSKPCTHQPTIFIILPIIGERKKKRGQEKANTHCFRHWVCHIGVGSTLVNHPKLPACSCAHSLSVRCIIDAFYGL
jgi:hypothetical protein